MVKCSEYFRMCCILDLSNVCVSAGEFLFTLAFLQVTRNELLKRPYITILELFAKKVFKLGNK